jgi:hypothetical protein
MHRRFRLLQMSFASMRLVACMHSDLDRFEVVIFTVPKMFGYGNCQHLVATRIYSSPDSRRAPRGARNRCHIRFIVAVEAFATRRIILLLVACTIMVYMSRTVEEVDRKWTVLYRRPGIRDNFVAG